MITISLCMIVKNEEANLARCLDSLKGLMEEIIIVDTGSTDDTKKIAKRYTNRIYDFQWVDDFSAARNFAFSKATQEYIYTADADEVLDEENRQKFFKLKELLLPEIDLVQMKYGNQLSNGTVYNFDEEYRPKLFKRLRPFVWEEPIHEQVRLSPVLYDSDIVVRHEPEENHSARDLRIFRNQTKENPGFTGRTYRMYVRELYLNGTLEDYRGAEEFFGVVALDNARNSEELRMAFLILASSGRLHGDAVQFFKFATKILVEEACSEICIELGHFYEDAGDYDEAVIWYYNAAFETLPIVSMKSAHQDAADGLKRVYTALGMPDAAEPFVQDIEKRKQDIE